MTRIVLSPEAQYAQTAEVVRLLKKVNDMVDDLAWYHQNSEEAYDLLDKAYALLSTQENELCENVSTS